MKIFDDVPLFDLPRAGAGADPHQRELEAVERLGDEHEVAGGVFVPKIADFFVSTAR